MTTEWSYRSSRRLGNRDDDFKYVFRTYLLRHILSLPGTFLPDIPVESVHENMGLTGDRSMQRKDRPQCERAVYGAMRSENSPVSFRRSLESDVDSLLTVALSHPTLEQQVLSYLSGRTRNSRPE